MNKKVTRRKFLEGSALFVGGGTLLSSVPMFAYGKTSTKPPIIKRYKEFTATHWQASYGEVNGDKFVRQLPFSKDPFPSPALSAMPDRVYTNTRIKYPMVRKGFLKNGYKSDPSERGRDEFVRVSWDDALDLVASELERVKKNYGNKSIFTGTVDWHSVGKLHNPPVLLRRLLGLHGGFIDCSGDFSVQAAMTILPHVTGNIEVYNEQTAWPVILENTEFMMLFGSDIIKNNQIGWDPTDHYTYSILPKLKSSGIEIISIDPRITETAEYLGAKTIQLRPNTDVALMLGMAYTLYKENLYDKNFLNKYTYGFNEFLPYLLGKTDGTPKTPQWAEKITEVNADTIVDLARKMVKKRTMLVSGWALQRQDHGEQPPWMLVTLAAMVGQIGIPGGGFSFNYHYANDGAPVANSPSLPGMNAGTNPTNIVLPYDHILPDLLLYPGKTISWNGQNLTYPDIKMVYWAGGNPFSHEQDRNKLIRAWRKPQTTIIHEIYWTLTAKFADIVLPTTTTFERNDIENMSEYSFKYMVSMHKVIDPLYESRPEYEIFSDLADKLGLKNKFTEGKSEMEWIKHFYTQAEKDAKAKNISMPDFDTFWKNGYVEFEVPEKSKQYVRYADFRKNPALNPLGTPSGKIEIYSKTIEGFHYEDCPPHPTWIEPFEWLGNGEKTKYYPFHLLSPHPPFRLHSQLDNTWIRKWYEVKGLEPIWMNPKDAMHYGLKNGDAVRVFNKRGELIAGLVVTDRVRHHVLILHEGAWPDPKIPGKEGVLDTHGNIDILTSDKGTSKLANGNTSNTLLVAIEKYTGKLPENKAFKTPDEYLPSELPNR